MSDAEGLDNVEFEKLKLEVVRQDKITELVRDLTDDNKDKPKSKRP